MKLISWNVNGLRAVLKKNFREFIAEATPDILCLQETKARPEQVEIPSELADYHASWNSAQKPGYSGVATFSKSEPLSVRVGLGEEKFDQEGRVLTTEYEHFFVVNVYTPNSQGGLVRLPFREAWDHAFRAYVKGLESEGKPVIVCGDLNVAHQEIDLARPAANRNKTPGFSDQERAGMTRLLNEGFVDSFRHFHPDTTDAYSWWSYRGGARAKNVGWRLDYFCLSTQLAPNLQAATILNQVLGSDHCPVQVELGF